MTDGRMMGRMAAELLALRLGGYGRVAVLTPDPSVEIHLDCLDGFLETASAYSLEMTGTTVTGYTEPQVRGCCGTAASGGPVPCRNLRDLIQRRDDLPLFKGTRDLLDVCRGTGYPSGGGRMSERPLPFGDAVPESAAAGAESRGKDSGKAAKSRPACYQ